ncbi:MAG: hypothetical protein Q9160_004366 [Pyrenula sp. 1 TL-2023]
MKARTLRSRPPPSVKLRENLHSQDEPLLSPQDSTFEPATALRSPKRRKYDNQHTTGVDERIKSADHSVNGAEAQYEELSGATMSHLQQASARNLRNHPDIRNPVAVALWVVQKLDLVYQEKHSRPQPAHGASRASSVSSKAESPIATAGRQRNWSDTLAKESNSQRDHRKHLQTARKQRQREDNWVKRLNNNGIADKENDVVARVRHNEKKRKSSGAFDGADQSDGETKSKRQKGSKAALEPDLQVSINDAFDRAMSKTVTDLAPRLSDQPEFRRETAQTFIQDRKNLLDSGVWQAGMLLVSVLPALTETAPSEESSLAANNLLDSLQNKAAPESDDFFHALEVIVQSSVMVGVGIVMSRLYPDRSRSFPETERALRTRNSGPGPDYHQQHSIEDGDSDEYVENMNSGPPTRSSGRSRKQTKRYQEAFPGLISKRKRNTSTSPETTSPIQNAYPKKRSHKLRANERSPSNSSFDFDETETIDDASRGRAKARSSRVTRTSIGTATNVTTIFQQPNSTDKESSESYLNQNQSNDRGVFLGATSELPQIQVSEDFSDMARSDLVQNLMDVMKDIDEGLYDTDSDDDDSEAILSAVSHHKAKAPSSRTTRAGDLRTGDRAQGRTRSSDRILRSSRSSKTSGSISKLRSSKPSPLNITTNAEQAESWQQANESTASAANHAHSPPRQPSALPVNAIISAEEGKIASVHYASLAQQAGVPQGHPMSTGLSYPELVRPYTDKDGWTSTGIINEFSEEIIHINKNKWVVFDPSTACEQPPTGIPAPRRFKSLAQATEDRVFGYPPKPSQSKEEEEEESDESGCDENVSHQRELYEARLAVDERGLPFEESMTVQDLTMLCQESDAKKASQPVLTPAEDDIASIEGESNIATESVFDPYAKGDQSMSNGTPVSEALSPQRVGVDSYKDAAPYSQRPPPAIGYSPVRRSENHRDNSVDFHQPPASPKPFTSKMSSHTPPVSAGPSRALLYNTPDQPYQPYHFQPTPHIPFSNRPFLPQAPQQQQQQRFTFVPPSDSYMTPQNPNSPRPHTLSANSTNTITPPSPTDADPHSPDPTSQILPSPTTTAQGQVTPALNGGFPGGGLIINPRKKDERPVYKKKIGPDYKMELTNGRLARPGPNTPPQPTPKRGGMIIDFTGF